jgi:hypothetical protein
MTIFEISGSDDFVEWRSITVSRFEAYKRRSSKSPIVDKYPDALIKTLSSDQSLKFLMTLMVGDTVRFRENGQLVHGHVETIRSNGRIGISLHNEALGQKSEFYKLKPISKLRDLDFEKTHIDPLGNVRISHD